MADSGAGGLLAALKDAGVDEADANVYVEGVRRGWTLVSAPIEDNDTSRVEAALDRGGGVNATARGTIYRQEGWTAFDQNAPLDLDDGVGRTL